MISKRFAREFLKPPRGHIVLELTVPGSGVVLRKPLAEARQLSFRKPFHRPRDFFDRTHIEIVPEIILSDNSSSG